MSETMLDYMQDTIFCNKMTQHWVRGLHSCVI